MDIASLPVSLQIDAALLSKVKDQSEAVGKAALSLIESATESAPRLPPEAHRGRNINVKA